ncbi:MAG: ABC-2 family transporter protein [Patescibacteria group bacterium]|jgi:ABC-2 type transport system permease protein
MRKYLTIAKNKTQAEFSHRANVFAYIGGNMLDLFVQVVIWTAIFSSVSAVGGYTKNEMITYVVVGWIFMYLSTNYGYEEYIKKDVHEGKLSNYLIKPVNYLSYISFHSIGRLLFAFSIILLQALFFILFFRETLIFSLNPAGVIIFILMFIFSYAIKFSISVIIGFMSFWASDVSGLYFALNILNRFLSGAFFPIAFLPPLAAKLSYFFPFTYTYFLPIQFYLGKNSLADGALILAGQALWIIILYIIIKFVWKKGIYKYEGTGI